MIVALAGLVAATGAGLITNRDVYQAIGVLIGVLNGGAAWAWLAAALPMKYPRSRIPDWIWLTGTFVALPTIVIPMFYAGLYLGRWVHSTQHG